MIDKGTIMDKHIYLTIISILLICLMPQFGLNGKHALCIEVEKEKEASETEKSELKENSRFAQLIDTFNFSCMSNPMKSSMHFLTMAIVEKPVYLCEAACKFFNHSPPELV
jgi:hypothetical protein